MHVEGWLYDPIILALLRDCTSEIMNPRPHFKALQYRLCSLLLLVTLLFFIVPITKIISTIITTLVSPSLIQTNAPIQFTIVFGVLGTQETFWLQGCLRETITTAGCCYHDTTIRDPSTKLCAMQ